MSIINNIKKTLIKHKKSLLYASGATVLIISGIGYLVRHGILRPFYKNSETQTIEENNGEIFHPEDLEDLKNNDNDNNDDNNDGENNDGENKE